MQDEELAKVTARHLRDAEQICRRRLAEEHRGSRGNPGPVARFEVANRIEADARVAHSELREARPTDFPTPAGLWPEQQRLYSAAAAGYLALFGGRSVRRADLDPWETTFPDLGVRLVGNPGLAVEDADESAELWVLRLGSSGRFDAVDRRFITLRCAGWAPHLRVLAADLLLLACDEFVLDIAAEEAEARAWLQERVQAIRELVADGRARLGADCNGCAFVAGCPPHTGP